ncbi:MAG: hypothetical protein ACHQ49_14690 [Elusimicrobiota bacterium]
MNSARLRTAVAACVLAAACRRAPQASAPSRKLADAVRDAHAVGPCRTAVAPEWPAGWPVPLEAAGGRRFKIFFYTLTGAPPAAPRLRTPVAEAVIETDPAAVVECRARPEPPRDVDGPRWTAAAAALGADAFDAKAGELDALTESVAVAYAARRPPTAADSELARRYLALFETLAEPPFLAEYYGLNPSFWEWVRAATGRSIRP